jgi:hypothetical protein
MDYAKPKISVLGEAGRVIEQIPTIKGPVGVIEFANGPRLNPAYDLDE